MTTIYPKLQRKPVCMLGLTKTRSKYLRDHIATIGIPDLVTVLPNDNDSPYYMVHYRINGRWKSFVV